MSISADRTRNPCAALFQAIHHELSAAEVRPIAHHCQTHSILMRVLDDTDAVVGDAKGEAIARFLEANSDVLGISMFERVADGFLRDAIKVHGHSFVFPATGAVAVKGAIDAMQSAH